MRFLLSWLNDPRHYTRSEGKMYLTMLVYRSHSHDGVLPNISMSVIEALACRAQERLKSRLCCVSAMLSDMMVDGLTAQAHGACH